MKYVIAFMFSGDLKKYHFNLTKTLSEKFEIRNVGKRINPHMTLKSLGDISEESIELVERVLMDVCSKENPFEIVVENISRFNTGVVFLDIKNCEKLKDFYLRLYSSLKEIKDLPVRDKFECEKKYFHSTICSKDIKNKIEDIVKFLSNEKPSFLQTFYSISLLRLENDRWNTYKNFKFC